VERSFPRVVFQLRLERVLEVGLGFFERAQLGRRKAQPHPGATAFQRLRVRRVIGCQRLLEVAARLYEVATVELREPQRDQRVGDGDGLGRFPLADLQRLATEFARVRYLAPLQRGHSQIVKRACDIQRRIGERPLTL